MQQLGVNVDHVATLRQARGTPYPDPVQAARIAVNNGADLITVHLREDRRHIQDDDVRRLRAELSAPLNLEMAATPEMQRIATEIQPKECCVVPEKRSELTTEGGLNVAAGVAMLTDLCHALTERGIAVSLFIDPDPVQIDASARTGATMVELHTGRYAEVDRPDTVAAELAVIQRSIKQALEAGLQVNAGHGLHYGNVQAIAALPGVSCLNIGHSIVARAINTGLAKAVRDMKTIMRNAAGSRS